jgi:hypothetical protein
MLEAHNISSVKTSKGPRVAFDVLLNLIEITPDYWDLPPKKYTILNAPSEPVTLTQAYDLISKGDFSLRNNYAGCFFLENDSYLFFMLKKDYEYTYEQY